MKGVHCHEKCCATSLWNSFHNILCQAWWCHSDVFRVISVWAWSIMENVGSCVFGVRTSHHVHTHLNQSGLITTKEEECGCSLRCISLLEVACRLAPELRMEGYWKDSLHTLCIYCWESTTGQLKCSSQMSALQHNVNSCPATLLDHFIKRIWPCNVCSVRVKDEWVRWCVLPSWRAVVWGRSQG